jgi:hypothetical protein
MKLKNLILGTMFAGLAASASAQTTDITITGATAFRTATLQAIYDAYDSVGNLGTDFFVCHSASGNTTSALTGSNQGDFRHYLHSHIVQRIHRRTECDCGQQQPELLDAGCGK